MDLIAGWIARVLDRPEDTALGREIEAEVAEVCAAYPLFAWEPVLR